MSSKKANICCVKPPEPSFLTEIKKKVGYKEGPTLEDKIAKRRRDENESDEDEDEDEIPSSAQIVVEKDGDLTSEEVEKIRKVKEDLSEKKKIDEGKITFKKPTKRDTSDSDSTAKVSSTKRQNTGKTADRQADIKPVNNSRLLSFEDEDG